MQTQTETVSSEPLKVTPASSVQASDRTVVNKTALGNCSDNQDKEAILKSINDVRKVARKCGATFYPAAAALKYNDKLTSAALGHAEYLARTGELTHTQTTKGLETTGKRVKAADYNYNYVAENVAHGDAINEEMIAKLVDSEGHCKNIMNAKYQEVGFACMIGTTNAKYPTSWVQNFAQPK